MGEGQKVREILCKWSSDTSNTHLIYITIFLGSGLLSVSFSPGQNVDLAFRCSDSQSKRD